MPFKSEKQRRFLWAEHPEIAKRWAHEYPNQEKLPMYAHNNKADGNQPKAEQKEPVKEAALGALRQALVAHNSYAVLRVMQDTVVKYAYAGIAKKSESILQYLDVPHSEKPVAAGDEHVQPKQEVTNKSHVHAPEILEKIPELFSQEKKQRSDSLGQETAQKLAAVLAPHLRPNTPQNAGLDVATLQRKIMEDKNKMLYGGNPLPLAEQAKQQPAPQQQPKPAQPQKPTNVMSNTLVGNPIGNQGPLNSRNGVPTAQQNVTGNQAFGSANRVPGITPHGFT